jgi:hypothetical protein
MQKLKDSNKMLLIFKRANKRFGQQKRSRITKESNKSYAQAHYRSSCNKKVEQKWTH